MRSLLFVATLLSTSIFSQHVDAAGAVKTNTTVDLSKAGADFDLAKNLGKINYAFDPNSMSGMNLANLNLASLPAVSDNPEKLRKDIEAKLIDTKKQIEVLVGSEKGVSHCAGDSWEGTFKKGLANPNTSNPKSGAMKDINDFLKVSSPKIQAANAIMASGDNNLDATNIDTGAVKVTQQMYAKKGAAAKSALAEVSGAMKNLPTKETFDTADSYNMETKLAVNKDNKKMGCSDKVLKAYITLKKNAADTVSLANDLLQYYRVRSIQFTSMSHKLLGKLQ